MFGSLTWTGFFERGDCVKRFPEPRKSLPQSSFYLHLTTQFSNGSLAVAKSQILFE
jgi:hypothetical protein